MAVELSSNVCHYINYLCMVKYNKSPCMHSALHWYIKASIENAYAFYSIPTINIECLI